MTVIDRRVAWVDRWTIDGRKIVHPATRPIVPALWDGERVGTAAVSWQRRGFDQWDSLRAVIVFGPRPSPLWLAQNAWTVDIKDGDLTVDDEGRVTITNGVVAAVGGSSGHPPPNGRGRGWPWDDDPVNPLLWEGD